LIPHRRVSSSCQKLPTVIKSLSVCPRGALAASDWLIWPRVGGASITFPQWWSVDFLPLRTRIPRETRKSPARHPSLTLRPSGAGRSPLGLLIAIEAAWAARVQTRRHVMATIGSFTKSGDDFTGTVKTVALNVKTKIARAEKENDKAPDYRIFAGQTEFGAAWKKTSGAGREYLSVKLDDPSFPAPIYASLVAVEGGDGYTLIWSRRNSD
jgi:uncharacterized protein (DUF736 family)